MATILITLSVLYLLVDIIIGSNRADTEIKKQNQ